MPETTINTAVTEATTSVPETELSETMISENSAETAITESAITENDDEIISRAADSKVSEIFESMGVTLSEETLSETEIATEASITETAVINTETELSTLLPPETTVAAVMTTNLPETISSANNVTSAETSTQTVETTVTAANNYSQYIPAVSLAVVGAATAMLILKKRKSKKKEGKSAKDMDAERIEATRAKKSKKKDKSDKTAVEKTIFQRRFSTLFHIKKFLRIIYGFLERRCIPKPIPLMTSISILLMKNSSICTSNATSSL